MEIIWNALRLILLALRYIYLQFIKPFIDPDEEGTK